MAKVIKKIFNNYINDEGVYLDNNNNKYQFLKEIMLTVNLYDVYCQYKNKKIISSRYESYDYNNHKFL
jgi:hypothetical protein